MVLFAAHSTYCLYILLSKLFILLTIFLQQYDAFERNDVKLQEDMKHAKTLIKKQQVA